MIVVKTFETLSLLLICSCFIANSDGKVLFGRGTFKINGIFPLQRNGRTNYQSGIMMAEAMKYAVETVNNASHLMFGYKLGVNTIYNSETENEVRSNVMSTFLTKTPFLIGPYSSETSYVTSILTSTFRQVAISYSAVFSDLDTTAMLRTVPSNLYRVQALLDLVERLQWNYLAVISSYGHDGERDALHFTTRLSSIGVCLAEQVDLPRKHDQGTFEKAILSINKDSRTKAIVLFTTLDDSRRVFQALKKLKLSNYFRVICAFGCTNYKEVVEGLEDVAVGTISLDIHYKREMGFEKYFLSRTPKTNNEPSFLKYWQDVFNCSWDRQAVNQNHCTGDEQLEVGKGYYPSTPVHTVIDAVYSIAYALNTLIELVCHYERKWMSNSTQCIIIPKNTDMYSKLILDHLQALSYSDGTLKEFRPISNEVKYDVHLFAMKAGDSYSSDSIGSWAFNRSHDDVSKVDFHNRKTFLHIQLALLKQNNSRKTFRAICSKQCHPGYVRIRDRNAMKAQCCWNCQKCQGNSINLNDSCVECGDKEMAFGSKCKALPERYLDINRSPMTPFPLIMLFLSFIGLGLTLFVVVVFIKFNANRIVRAYGRDLCYMILSGIALTFLCPFPFLTKPSISSCVLRGSLPGIAFLTCYAPLFLKINRIYRIFLHAQTSVARPALVSSKSLLLCSFGIVSVQFLLAGVWFASKLPGPDGEISRNRDYIIAHCKGERSPILMLLNLVLSVIFMLSSTVLAFKTRHFPKNYNESKYIGITLYITCVAWALFFPAYFLTSGHADFEREYLMCSVCVVIGFITLLGLFGHKVKLLLCTSKGKLKQKGNAPPSYSFSFDSPQPASEIKGLTVEQQL